MHLREEDDDLAAVVRLEEGADQGQAADIGEHRQRRARSGSGCAGPAAGALGG